MMIFDVAGNRPVWAGTSESVNPKDAQALVKAPSWTARPDQIRKDGLIRRR